MAANSLLPCFLAPLANAVSFPLSFVSITTRLSYSPAGSAFNIIPVTLTGDALAMVGIVTDGMVAYGYDYVRPAVFENVLMLKSTRDEQSAKIIDLIFQNVTVELSTSMYFGNFSSEIGQFFNRKLGQQDITSLYASVKDSLEASLKSTEEQYKEIAANLGK